MSEFRWATKTASLYFDEISTFDDTKLNVSDHENKIIELLKNMSNKLLEVEKMKEIQRKYVKKINEKDPITGNDRYGPQMKRKIMEFENILNDLYSKINEKVKLLENKNSIIITKKDEEIKARKLLEMEAKEEEKLKTVFANQLVAAQEEQEILEKLNQDKAIKEMATQALLVRERKQAEIERKLEEHQKKIDAIIAKKDSYNKMPKKDCIALKATLDTLKENAKEAYKIPLKTILEIIENINTHPDDETFRRLNVASATLQNKLLQYNGGVESLIAIGFNAIVHSDIVDMTDMETLPKILLTLTEPNPEVDMDSWISWYDHMKASKEIVEEALA